MRRVSFLLFGITVYAIFFATFLYLIGFLQNLVVPRSIDSGPATPLGEALLVNLLLVAAFGVQHTIMARRGFKRWWTGIVPQTIERSMFVLVTCVILALMFWQWRTHPGVVWSLDGVAATSLLALSWVGWGIVLLSTFLIDHFELFGLRQVVSFALGRTSVRRPFVERALYRWVRHPLMLGFLIAFWATPQMTVGHLIFSAAFTGYILLGIRVEERDLRFAHGEAYEDYRRRVPALLPLGRRRAGSQISARTS